MNSHWTDRTFYSFDTETTAANPLEAHVVTATVVKIVNGEYVDKRSWILNPAVDIPAEATEINGLTTEWARENGMDAKQGISEILDMVEKILTGGFPFVVYNAAYDLTILEKQAEFYGLKPLRKRLPVSAWNTVVDPFVIAKGLEQYWRHEFVKGRTFKLPAVCERYGVEFVESHDATDDAVGAAKLAIKLMNEDKDLLKKGPAALNVLQKKWRSRSQNGLRKHFDKNNIEHDGVDASWPLHTQVM